MVEEALAVAEVVVVVVEDLEEEVVALEVEVDDMTIRKKHLYYLIHIVLTVYEVLNWPKRNQCHLYMFSCKFRITQLWLQVILIIHRV